MMLLLMVLLLQFAALFGKQSPLTALAAHSTLHCSS
jgi:hypothetical protein